MNTQIVIVTPTYNRPENLNKLFATLLEQTRKDFLWMIIDDGSRASYASVVETIKANADFKVDYYKKENGGKSSAVNYAFDRLGEEGFALIIDDDEYLYPNAIEKVIQYVAEYDNTNVGLINFNRADMNGKAIASPVFENDFVMSIQEHASHKYHTDGYVGYFLKKLGKTRFPIFNGEKYIGPSVLMMLASEEFDLLWAHEILGYTDYLVGGLTETGKPLRMKSPLGMAARAILMQSQESGLKNRFKLAVGYYAYLFIAQKKQLSLETKRVYKIFLPVFSKPLGWILYRYWKNKYKF